jgi:hypothetical protein
MKRGQIFSVLRDTKQYFADVNASQDSAHKEEQENEFEDDDESAHEEEQDDDEDYATDDNE